MNNDVIRQLAARQPEQLSLAVQEEGTDKNLGKEHTVREASFH